MTERLKRIRCADWAWFHLLEAMNKTSDEVTVANTDLVEVMNCHDHFEGVRPPEDFVVKAGRQKTIVDCKQLFAFIQDHGKFCGVGK